MSEKAKAKEVPGNRKSPKQAEEPDRFLEKSPKWLVSMHDNYSDNETCVCRSHKQKKKKHER